MSKSATLLLIDALTVSNLLMVKASTKSAATSKPSAPKSTVKLVNSSYDIPPTTTIEPYTGKTMTDDGPQIESKAIESRIKNEPSTPLWMQESTSAANWSIGYYNTYWKGHFETDWHEIFPASKGCLSRDSASEYTTFSSEGEYSSKEELKLTTQRGFKWRN